MRYFVFCLLLFTVACSHETPKNLTKKVNQLIAGDHYEKALDLLHDADSSQTKASLDTLREKVHLNYGIFKEYQGKKGAEMHDRMNGALRQYVEVLKINRQNQKAISEVKQIMGIYSTMPGKAPDDEVVEELHKLGFDFSRAGSKRQK